MSKYIITLLNYFVCNKILMQEPQQERPVLLADNHGHGGSLVSYCLCMSSMQGTSRSANIASLQHLSKYSMSKAKKANAKIIAY